MVSWNKGEGSELKRGGGEWHEGVQVANFSNDRSHRRGMGAWRGRVLVRVAIV